MAFLGMGVAFVTAACSVFFLFCRVIQTRSSEVQKLTPRILDQAELVSRAGGPHHRGNGSDDGEQEAEFDSMAHQWAGNMRELIDAMQQASLPWSHRAQQLVDAAQSGEGLEEQVQANTSHK